MVNVTKGILVECDAAMKEFLNHLDETKALGQTFIIQVNLHPNLWSDTHSLKYVLVASP